MDRTTAEQQLNTYAQQQERIRRRYIAPTMIFFAIYGFLFLVTGGFDTFWKNLILFSFFAVWLVYSRRLTSVSWRFGQHLRLFGVLLLGFGWIILCNMFFGPWNPLGLPFNLNGLLGGVLAALPFLVLARSYRP